MAAKIVRFGSYSTPASAIAIDAFASRIGVAKGAMTEILVLGINERVSEAELANIVAAGKKKMLETKGPDGRTERGAVMKRLFALDLEQLAALEKLAMKKPEAKS